MEGKGLNGSGPLGTLNKGLAIPQNQQQITLDLIHNLTVA